MRVGLGIPRYERRRGNAQHILGELLIIQQLAAGYAHELDTDAHKAHVVDVRRYVRARSGETHPRPVCARLREDTPTHVLREVFANGDFTPPHPVCLGAAAALAVSRLPSPAHWIVHRL